MPDPSPHAVWDDLLSALARRAADAESGRTPPSWRAPSSMTPLPPELAEQAAATIAAQQRAIARLREQGESVRLQLRALGKVPLAYPGAVPVYIDAIG